MTNKTPSIISVIITIVLLVLTALVILFSQLVILNGFGERAGTASLVTSVICQGISVIIAAVLAGRLTRFFIEKFNWNKALAVIAAVIAGTIPGGILMTIALFIAVAVADSIQ